MQHFQDYIDIYNNVTELLTTDFSDEQIDNASYFNITETDDNKFKLSLFDDDDNEIGTMISNDPEYLFAYIEEEFELDEVDLGMLDINYFV